MSTLEQASAITYRDALNAAMHRAMQTYPEAIVFGEDVAAPGGVFGVTRGLTDEFGDRVFDTPISETAMLGAALGAAMMGRRPIVEIMWADFLFVGIDQLVNQAANVRWLTRGRSTAPFTVRTQQGSLTSSSAQHSRCVEALAVPHSRAARRPALEPGRRLHHAAGRDRKRRPHDPDRASRHLRPAGRGRPGGGDSRDRRREGCPKRQRRHHRGALADGRSRAPGGRAVWPQRASTPRWWIPRWLSPFDWDTVDVSLAKTNRLVVVHEAVRTCGFGAEVAAQAAERGFWHLDGPVVRVTAPDTPKPSALTLEAVAIPDAERVARGVRQALAGAPVNEQESA